MWCVKCGKELAENARFCIGCGTPVIQNGERTVGEKQMPDAEPMPAPEKVKLSKPKKPMTKRKKITLAVLLGVLVLAIAAAVLVASRYFSSEQKTLSAYEEDNYGVTLMEGEKNGTGKLAYYIWDAREFSDGVAWIEICNKEDGVIVERRWACIDTNGNVLFLLEPDTTTPDAFENGVAEYETYDDEYNIIDKNGNVIFSSKDGLFDAVITHDNGFFAVYTYTESYDEAGYKVFFLNNKGEITMEIDGLRAELPELINCGEGVFAEKICQNAAAEVTYRYYDARTGNQYEIDGIGYYADMSYIFHNGYAVIEGPRMGDIPRLVSTDGQITELNDFDYGSYYDFGPVSDGGFVCTSYYQDKVEHVWFYDIATGSTTALGNYGERVQLSRAEDLFFDNGYLLLPLVGADGKNYYTILNKHGQSLFDPTVCESAHARGDDRIVVKYAEKTVVYDGKGEAVFELPAGQSVALYRNGISQLVEENHSISNIYIDLNGTPLFDDDILFIASREK